LRGPGEVLLFGEPPYRQRLLTFLSLRQELAEKAPGAAHYDLRFRGRIFARRPAVPTPSEPGAAPSLPAAERAKALLLRAAGPPRPRPFGPDKPWASAQDKPAAAPAAPPAASPEAAADRVAAAPGPRTGVPGPPGGTSPGPPARASTGPPASASEDTH
jgi:hypothetical protein